MATVFPGAIDSFTNPQPTDQVNLVPHAEQHQNANDAIVAIETYIKSGVSTTKTYLATNTGDAYAISGTGFTSYDEANYVFVRVDNTNTGPITLDIDGIGPLPVVTVLGEALDSNVLNSNDTYIIRYESNINKLVIAGQADLNRSISGLDFTGVSIQGAVNYPISGATSLESVVYDGVRYVYITNAVQGLVYRFDTDTNSFVGPTASVPGARHYCSFSGGFLYVGQSGGNLMYKVDVSTMRVASALSLTGNNNTSCVEGGYLYTCSSAGNVQKINLSTFAIEPETNNLGSTTFAPSIVSDGSYLYVYCGGVVRKMNIGTLSTVASYSTAGAGCNTTSIFIKGSYLYLTSNGINATLRKLDTSLTLVSQSSFSRSMFGMVGFDDKNILVINTELNTVSKINIDTMAEVGTPISTGNGNELIRIGSFFYTTQEVSPYGLNKINLLNITPPKSGDYRLFFKTDGKLYRMDSNGAEQLIGTQS